MWSFEVITKESPTFDFTFTRYFEWTLETNKHNHYRCIFKNEDDYRTAWDMTSFNQLYKDTKIYKWNNIGFTADDKHKKNNMIKEYDNEINEINKQIKELEEKKNKLYKKMINELYAH